MPYVVVRDFSKMQMRDSREQGFGLDRFVAPWEIPTDGPVFLLRPAANVGRVCCAMVFVAVRLSCQARHQCVRLSRNLSALFGTPVFIVLFETSLLRKGNEEAIWRPIVCQRVLRFEEKGARKAVELDAFGGRPFLNASIVCYSPGLITSASRDCFCSKFFDGVAHNLPGCSHCRHKLPSSHLLSALKLSCNYQ